MLHPVDTMVNQIVSVPQVSYSFVEGEKNMTRCLVLWKIRHKALCGGTSGKESLLGGM